MAKASPMSNFLEIFYFLKFLVLHAVHLTNADLSQLMKISFASKQSKETIAKYMGDCSNIFAALLDASKAFDFESTKTCFFRRWPIAVIHQHL